MRTVEECPRNNPENQRKLQMRAQSVGEREKGTLHLSTQTLQKRLSGRPPTTRNDEGRAPALTEPPSTVSAGELLLSKLLRTGRCWGAGGDALSAVSPILEGPGCFQRQTFQDAATHMTRREGARPHCPLSARLSACCGSTGDPAALCFFQLHQSVSVCKSFSR